MRLTPRCIDLLRLLSASRWLSTSQIHRRFFASATVDAARKRLRKLNAGNYILVFRDGRMSEAIFTLGRTGRQALQMMGANAAALERKPPIQREHFLAVNDVRVAAELAGDLSYFFAYWELPGLGWRRPLIPDAIFRIAERNFALEFDRGGEGIQFFIRTKMAAYANGLEGLPLSAVLVVADRVERVASLARAIGEKDGQVLFSTIDVVRQCGLLAPIFQRWSAQRNGLLQQGLFSDCLDVERGQHLQLIENRDFDVVVKEPLKADRREL